MNCQVRIKFLRIQGFIFATPRLKSMVGANALLGEITRRELPCLAKKNNARLPENFAVDNISGVSGIDPLREVEEEDLDAPRNLYQRGILRRDGGHFAAIFADEKNAKNFIEEAGELLYRDLPGLRWEAEILNENEIVNDVKVKGCRSQPQSLLDLPQLQVCQEQGKGSASEIVKEGEKDIVISQIVARQRDKTKDFYKGNTHDIIGLLNRCECLPKYDKSPPDLDTLCQQDYLAVIHADGNAAGVRFSEWQGNSRPSNFTEYLCKEANAERFWQCMRVAVRRALVDAIQEVFAGDEGKFCPYQLLILGGDDLLLVCQAKYAMRFVVAYAHHLQNHDMEDGKPLTIGAGVAIASAKFPFYRLYEIAEELAKSAKRLYRSLPAGQEKSVVDWTMVTYSWAQDPIAMRKREMSVRYRVDGSDESLCLSRRPYVILGKDAPSLEKLLENVEFLQKRKENGKLARSQLYNLVYQLRKGKRYSKLLFDELPKETKTSIKQAGIDKLWKDAGGNCWKTSLVDLFELYEITNIGERHEEEE